MAVRRATTLTELMVVISILASTSALLLPAIQQARESSRANVCRNNLKQIGLAVLNFESQHRHFPKGAEGRYDRKLSPVPMFGISWWAETLSTLDGQIIADRLDRLGANTGWVQLNSSNGELIDEFAPNYWFCPSSSISRLLSIERFRIAAPSYVGIAGATNYEGFAETRVSPCCRSDGEISAGGILIPNTVIRVSQITDGLSMTTMVGEQSDEARTKSGESRRIDGSYPNGWLTGTNALGIPPDYGSPLAPAYNLATLRYALNEHRYELPGVYVDHGANNPLLSAHPGIVHLLQCDGSVHAAADSMDVTVLKAAGTRDDGTLSSGDNDL